jgi:hypothetical protein
MMLQTDFFHRPAFLTYFFSTKFSSQEITALQAYNRNYLRKNIYPKKHHEKYNRFFGQTKKPSRFHRKVIFKIKIYLTQKKRS